MIRRFDACDPSELERGLTAAVAAARRGDLVVVPTESAYGIATDAFRADGLARLRELKNRDRQLPVPVFVGATTTIEGLVANLSNDARALIAAFWPGMLTLVGTAQPALTWEVGPLDDESVSIRMPLHPVAWQLALAVGPLALTGANIAGGDLPTTCDEAAALFGSGVAVYLDAGPCVRTETSSVVDVTRSPPVLLREGANNESELRRICPDLELLGSNASETSSAPKSLEVDQQDHDGP